MMVMKTFIVQSGRCYGCSLVGGLRIGGARRSGVLGGSVAVSCVAFGYQELSSRGGSGCAREARSEGRGWRRVSCLIPQEGLMP